MGTGHHDTSPDAGRGKTPMTDVRPLLELLETAPLSEMYTLLSDGSMTVPELIAALDVSKSTGYKYIEKLLMAGLASKAGEKDDATVYKSNSFEIVVTIEGETLRLTPALIRVVSERDSNETIDRFIEQFGIATLAEVIEVAPEYASGELTHRMIASMLDLPRGWTFDILDEVLPFVVDDLPESETFTPDDIRDSERVALLDDESDAPDR